MSDINNPVFALQVSNDARITSDALMSKSSDAGGSYGLLLQGLEQLFENYGLREHGQIVSNLTRLLVGLEDDADHSGVGLTAVLNKTSATTATLSFTGQATEHANAHDIQNLTVTLGDAAFTNLALRVTIRSWVS